jgi:hypothetical protein
MVKRRIYDVKSSIGEGFQWKCLEDVRRYWIFLNMLSPNMRRNSITNFALARTPSPSIPPPRGGREAEPLSLDGREVGERVLVAHHRI